MAVAVLIVAGISLFQKYRSRNAIQALKKLAISKATVMRDGKQLQVATEGIVLGDIMLIAEGESLAADGNYYSQRSFIK